MSRSWHPNVRVGSVDQQQGETHDTFIEITDNKIQVNDTVATLLSDQNFFLDLIEIPVWQGVDSHVSHTQLHAHPRQEEPLARRRSRAHC